MEVPYSPPPAQSSQIELARSYREETENARAQAYWAGYELGVLHQSLEEMDAALVRSVAESHEVARQFARGYHDGLLWRFLSSQFGPPS